MKIGRVSNGVKLGMGWVSIKKTHGLSWVNI